MSDLENQLRAELHRRAEHAPAGTALAERIVAAARAEARPSGRRGWPTWTMPLLAAGAVAAIVTGVFVGVSQIRHDASPTTPGFGTHAPTPPLSTPAPHPSPSPTLGSTSPTSAAASRTASVPDNPVGLNNFVVNDITFYGADDGWALGDADCLKGPGTCPAMVRTTDGGRTWHSMPQPPIGANGAATGIRFATDQIGYAYSDTLLEMTTDGGRTWTSDSGGALALETLDGNVIRLISTGGGCGALCGLAVEYAPLGQATWTRASLSIGPTAAVDSVQLVRSDSDAYVLTTGHTAGGAGTAYSTVYVSVDDGASWTARQDPCRGTTRPESDAVAIAAAPGGVLTALCQVRQAGAGGDFLVRSSDAGAHFAPSRATLPQFSAHLLAGDPSTVLVAAGQGSYRSTDGGASWAPITAVTGTATFVGFESPTLGRIVTDGGRTVWTTTDAGAHWTPFHFPG